MIPLFDLGSYWAVAAAAGIALVAAGLAVVLLVQMIGDNDWGRK